MNWDQPPEDCQHPGFFCLNTDPMMLVCWQCQLSFTADVVDDW